MLYQRTKIRPCYETQPASLRFKLSKIESDFSVFDILLETSFSVSALDMYKLEN